MNSLSKLSALILFGLFFWSCTLITEPERIYNTNAHPPEYYSFTFNNLDSNKHFDGSFRILFSPDVSYPVDLLRIFIDDREFTWVDTLPCWVSINSRNYSEGRHKLSFRIFQKVKPHGLLNLSDPPSSIFETNLYFDRTPPDIVNLSIPNADKNGVVLNWTQSVSQNFFAYLIYKSIGSGEFKQISAIQDKEITEFIDTSGTGLIGVEYRYKVAVTTDYKFTYQSQSNIENCVIGVPFVYNFKTYGNGPFYNEQLSRVYFMADDKLISFSSVDNHYINELQINGLANQEYEYITLNFSEDKSKIYLYCQGTLNLWIISAGDLSIIKKLALPLGGELYILDDSRIFLNSAYGYRIINTEYNRIEKSIDFMEIIAFPAVLNKDNSKLIVESYLAGGWGFKIIDVTNNEINIIDSVKTGKLYYSLQKGGNKLFCEGKWIYDLNSLEYLGALNPDEYIYSYAVNEDEKIALQQRCTYSINEFDKIECSRIRLYNSQTQLEKEFFLSCGYRMAISVNKIFTSINENQDSGKNILGFSLSMGN